MSSDPKNSRNNKRYLFFLTCMLLLSVLTSTLVQGINYLKVITHPLHRIQVRKRSSK